MQDKKNPNGALPCSNGRAGSERGSDETRAELPIGAYGGKKFGGMTVTAVGSQLCVRWPAKNHAKEYKVPNVQINLAPKSGKDPSQQELLRHKVIDLPYNNCAKQGGDDKRPCGGCFTVPKRAQGIYVLQWRWQLNRGEWYTSCADIEIGSKNNISQKSKPKTNGPKKNPSKKNHSKKNASKKKKE
ncbi:hypothetical protein BGZ70_007744 [Mortierella alpina]|uniref:Uncharacterized protein n=1 Tax=Mortierella alpina TaxID=64518 RepID=A0A9P6J541_MORAP|nr:hypothetical protein BGZ70_007744 [Mortierella alpina]